MGNHCIDLLEMLFGRTVEVSCFTGNLVQAYESEDTAVATLKFESGAIGVVDNMFNVPDAAARNALKSTARRGARGLGDNRAGLLGQVAGDAGERR